MSVLLSAVPAVCSDRATSPVLSLNAVRSPLYLDTPYGQVEAEWLQFSSDTQGNMITRISVSVQPQPDAPALVWIFQQVDVPPDTAAAEAQVLCMLDRGFGPMGQRLLDGFITLCQLVEPALHTIKLFPLGDSVRAYTTFSRSDRIEGPESLQALAGYMHGVYLSPGIRLVGHFAGLSIPAQSFSAHQKVQRIRMLLALFQDLGHAGVDLSYLDPCVDTLD